MIRVLQLITTYRRDLSSKLLELREDFIAEMHRQNEEKFRKVMALQLEAVEYVIRERGLNGGREHVAE